MSARVLVAYARGTGCDNRCAVAIAQEIADVPELEVDIQPLNRLRSLRPYVAMYVGWVHPSGAGRRELERFLNNNADLLADRPVWIVHHHPRCAHSRPGPMRMTRLVVTPPVQDLQPTLNVPPARHRLEPASPVG